MRNVRTLQLPTNTSHTASERVIQAIADRESVSPLDISPPLFDAIDPDALDRLHRDGRAGVTTEFQYNGYRVTVRDGGHVELDRPEVVTDD